MLRELTGLFSLGRESRYGLLSRLVFISAAFVYSITVIRLQQASLQRLGLLIFLETSMLCLILYHDMRLDSYLRGLKVIMIFVGLGWLFYLFSFITGIGPRDWSSAVVGMVKTTMFLLPMTLVLVWITPNEFSTLLDKLGIRTLGIMLRIALSQLPILLIETAESITTVRLKQGTRKVYKSIYCMLVQSIVLSKASYEAQFTFGLPKLRVSLLNETKNDVLLIILAALLSAVALLISI